MPDVTAQTRGRVIPLVALLLAIALLSVAVAAAASDHGRKRASLNRALAAEAREQAAELEDYFQRARALTLVTANNPAYRRFYEMPGSRLAKIRAGGPTMEDAHEGLSYLQDLFPESIGVARFIDRGGAEIARAVRGDVAPASELSPDESGASYFKPTLALGDGDVYQARPYLSPDTGEWVISNSAPVPVRFGDSPAIIHFEITVESFRRQAADTSDSFHVAVVEARSGRVVADTRYPQRAGSDVPLGRPGGITPGGVTSGFEPLDRARGNANRWGIVAFAGTPARSWLSELGVAEISMMLLALVLLGFAVLSFRSSQAQLRRVAMCDPLTGIPNRRRLGEDLERLLPRGTLEHPILLAIFDLDGFKAYNDTYGHPAGDALLVRLSARLDEAVKGWDEATAYRMGGDEFCVLAQLEPDGAAELLGGASTALSEHGEGFDIGASRGSVFLPLEAEGAKDALRIADQRLYANKSTSRASAGRQTTDALVRVLAERYPDIGEHLDDVTELCATVAEAMNVPEEERSSLLQAAALHDIGKAAVPDAILAKPGPLDEEEWAFMRQHTVIGERILAAAPSLTGAAQLVRWSHERYDGSGYPDGLSGEDIPLGARIIAVCDAFDAMSSSRPYRPTPMSLEGALAELRRCSGTHFDPEVVDAFCRTLDAKPLAASDRSL